MPTPEVFSSDDAPMCAQNPRLDRAQTIHSLDFAPIGTQMRGFGPKPPNWWFAGSGWCRKRESNSRPHHYE